MNKDKLYTQWTHQRRNIRVPEDFADNVMAKISNQPAMERLSLFDRVGTPSHLLTRWAAALGLIALGIYRIFFVTANLLLGSTL